MRETGIERYGKRKADLKRSELRVAGIEKVRDSDRSRDKDKHEIRKTY